MEELRKLLERAGLSTGEVSEVEQWVAARDAAAASSRLAAVEAERGAQSAAQNAAQLVWDEQRRALEDRIAQLEGARQGDMRPDDTPWWDEANQRKVWPSSAKFLEEFATPEAPFAILAAISLSTDPTVAALRLVLMTHPGEVWSDDERIVMGLDALVAEEIIDEVMRESILAAGE